MFTGFHVNIDLTTAIKTPSVKLSPRDIVQFVYTVFDPEPLFFIDDQIDAFGPSCDSSVSIFKYFGVSVTSVGMGINGCIKVVPKGANDHN
jgi:hypothetical protein